MYNLAIRIRKEHNAHVACSMKKGKWPKMTSCGPSIFEGDGLHVNLLKNTQNYGSSSAVIHITYYGKVANFPKCVA